MSLTADKCVSQKPSYKFEHTQTAVTYMLMKQKLGPAFTEPLNYPNIADFRIVDMFFRVSTNAKKDKVFNMENYV